jgi:hypothetical protein
MPDPAVDDEALIQQMLLSMLTNRQAEPVAESSPLQQGRAAKAAEMMGSSFWQGEPMYRNPAATYDFTDEGVEKSYLMRLANDAEHRAQRRPEDLLYRDAWQEGKQEDDRHPDWALPEGTPPWWLKH